MNTRLLMILRKAKTDEGFTLLELIVVVIMIGILAAIATPAYLNQSSRAKQAEGISNVGVMNNAQQAYYSERGRFALDLTELNIGIPAATDNYTFATVGVNSGISSRSVSTAQLLPGSSLKGFVGVTQLIVGANVNGEAQSSSILCSSQPGKQAIAPANTDDCGANQTRQ